MTHTRTTRLFSAITATLLLTLGTATQAQTAYPAKPVRIIVPIAAGSVTDVVLRAATPMLSQRLGQPVIIDNRPGASGVVGAEACARAAADGYTICAVYHSIMSFNPYTLDKLPYDPGKDFAPVGRLFFVTEGLVVPAAFPAQNVAELKTYARLYPSGVNLGTLGEGSLQELFVAWLNHEWKTKIVGVPYKGGGPIANAVTAGEIQIAQMGLGNFIGLVQSGQLKAIAVSADKRLKALPNVQTNDEAGLGGFPARPWWGIAAPAGTPPPIVARLNADFNAVFRDPKMLELMDARYFEAAVTSPAEFATFLKIDRESAGILVRLASQAPR
jgi:tripartite-type tricarboxylate transporter receptor subunit TctC